MPTRFFHRAFCFLGALALIACLAGCGGGGGSGEGHGALVFTLTIEEGSSGAELSAFLAEVDCAAEGIAAIEAEVLKGDEILAQGGPFDCEEGRGAIEEVPPGAGYTLVISALDAEGEELLRGSVEGLAVAAGRTTDAGTIVLRRVRNRPPVLAPLEDRIIFDFQTSVFEITAADPDPGDRLTLSLAPAPGDQLPPGATLVDNGDGTGRFTFVPPRLESPQRFAFVFTARDDSTLPPGPLSDTRSVVITVIPGGET